MLYLCSKITKSKVEKTEFTLLNKIQYPEDLRKLSVDDLPQLCKELREDIVEEVAVNPGHLASSLGVVEITTASCGTWGIRPTVIRF